MSRRKPKPQTEAPVVEQTVEQPAEEAAQAEPTPAEAPLRPARPVGTSNLATTIRAHRAKYQTALAPSGKKTTNNGDRVAAALLRAPHETLVAFCLARFGKGFGHLNKGHERMCCGNLVRAAAQKGDADTLAFLARFAEAEAV